MYRPARPPHAAPSGVAGAYITGRPPVPDPRFAHGRGVSALQRAPATPDGGQMIVPQFVNIASAQRDVARYPSQSEYIYIPRQPLQHVSSMSLVSCEFPKSDYLIRAGVTGNNVINILDAGATPTTQRVLLGEGNYATLSAFLDEVQQKLNAINNDTRYTVTSLSNHIVIENSTDDFTLLFQSGDDADQLQQRVVNSGLTETIVVSRGSAQKMMGFGIADYASVARTITSPSKLDIAGDRFALLEIHLNGESVQIIETDSQHRSFAKIDLNIQANEIKYFTASRDVAYARVFNPPLPSVTHIGVRWRRPDGTLYNPRGVDHSLLLRFNVDYGRLGYTPV